MIFKKGLDQPIFIPTTPEQFDRLIDRLMKAFQLPDRAHAVAIVANRIQHLPPDQAKTTLRYLGHCVLKNLAYQEAQRQANRIQHFMQVDQLIASLRADCNDQASRDLLEQAIDKGSVYAKEQLALLDGEPAYLQACPSLPGALAVSPEPA